LRDEGVEAAEAPPGTINRVHLYKLLDGFGLRLKGAVTGATAGQGCRCLFGNMRRFGVTGEIVVH